MRRIATLFTALALVLVAAPTAQADDEVNRSIDVHTKYFNVRDKLLACEQDRVVPYLSSGQRRACRTMRKRYTLYALYSEAWDYHFHCKTSRCPATPELMPAANKPIPRGAKVYR
jgi:hypothetical protein